MSDNKRGRPATGKQRHNHGISLTDEEWEYLKSHSMPASEFISQLIHDHQLINEGVLELRVREQPDIQSGTPKKDEE